MQVGSSSKWVRPANRCRSELVTGSSGMLRKDLSSEEFELFRDWIHHHSGMYLEESRTDSLRISLVTRATRFGFVDYDEYFRFLTTDEDEFKELMNLVTINETSFYRFPAQFDALRDTIIPEILDSKPKVSRSFRVWSAGCSTGEEPYTVAMSLLDSGLEALGYRTEVLGTDVSTQALDKAKRAVYPTKAVSGLPPAVVQRWFEPVKGGYRPVAHVRDTVELSYHNLIKEPYPLVLLANWDVVFCRNVTIYFRLESTRRVVNNFYESLNPGGYLFIGHSETLTSICDRFEPVEVGGVFLYRKPTPRRLFSFDDVVAKRAEAVRKPRMRTADLSLGNVGPVGSNRIRTQLTSSEHRVPQPAPVTASKPAAQTSATAAGLVEQARLYLDRGEPGTARQFADKALALDARNVDALLVRAFGFADSGEFEAAITDARAALAINPLLASGRYILGVIYLRQGDVSAAEEEFKRTLYIDADFVLAHFNLANIHRQRRELDEAIREYQNTVKAIYRAPEGQWTAFLGGFTPDLLVKICDRSLVECRKGH